MELVKREDHWALYNEDGHKIAATLPGCNSKLSIKNCEAIENGYDLDELTREACDITDPLRLDSQKYKQDPYFKIGFNKGFQKALEIKSDKNFSEEDVISMIEKSRETGLTAEYIILTNQQTEWEVEICCYVDSPSGWLDADSFNSPLLTNIGEPKLDADGCLILKRL